MKKLDQLLAFLAYGRRVGLQLMDFKNLKNFHLIFKGFTPNKAIFYDFKKYGYDSYVSDYDRYLKTVFINYQYRDLFRDKYMSYLFLRQYTDRVVPVYGLIDNGKLYLLNPTSSLEEVFNSEKKFVIKPRKGRGGSGVVVLEIVDGKYFLNGTPVSDLSNLFRGFNDHIFVPYVYPHEYSSKINPRSLNTIRLLTCVLDDKVQILRAGHRFGGFNTGYVDNFAQGGISANVDVETGVINDPTVLDKKKHHKYTVELHPDSKERILGVTIPHWDLVKDEIVKLHESIKFVKYVGWDIAITPQAFRIIEANYVSDVDGLQMHAPLLIDDQSKKFYSQYF